MICYIFQNFYCKKKGKVYDFLSKNRQNSNQSFKQYICLKIEKTQTKALNKIGHSSRSSSIQRSRTAADQRKKRKKQKNKNRKKQKRKIEKNKNRKKQKQKKTKLEKNKNRKKQKT